MVLESLEWKKELREKKRKLIHYNTKENFDNHFEKTFFQCERAVLYSAFIARILVESEKLSDEADAFSIKVACNSPIKNIDRLHRWMDEDEYDWENTDHRAVFGTNICNWLIHSYVFSFLFEESGNITGFFVSSDYDRNKVLYTILLEDWIKYLDFIISDDMVSMSMSFNEKKSDYILNNKTRGSR